MKNSSKQKKPIYKCWWFISIIVVLIIGGIGSALGEDENAKPSDAKTASATTAAKETTKKSEVPAREGSVGKSSKDISTLAESFNVLNVRNDTTGNWRYITIAESTDFLEYALSYYENHFKDDKEIHAIVNFTNKTTTKISCLGDRLSVTIYEYVDGEEHDANLMYSGMVYADYFIYIDNGDIEKIQ